MNQIAHLGDCLAAMREMPDNAFDLCIADPPYGISAATMGMGRTKKGKQTTTYKKSEWDEKRPEKAVFDEMRRVSRHQIIWGGNYFADMLPAAPKWIVWDKEQPEGVSFAMHELAYNTSPVGKAMIFRENPSLSKSNASNGDRRTALANARFHPTQKPVSLYKWLLKNYAKEGWRILDPFLGSGSSRIAAYEMGFDFVGYELDADYFAAQEKRFAKHVAQGRLLSPTEIYTPPPATLF